MHDAELSRNTHTCTIALFTNKVMIIIEAYNSSVLVGATDPRSIIDSSTFTQVILVVMNGMSCIEKSSLYLGSFLRKKKRIHYKISGACNSKVMLALKCQYG